jgi:hypothetical protein
MYPDAFADYVKSMRTYRDEFVAHLDSELEMRPPPLDIAQASAAHLYDHLLTHENEGGFFPDSIGDAAAVYARFSEDAGTVYRL